MWETHPKVASNYLCPFAIFSACMQAGPVTSF